MGQRIAVLIGVAEYDCARFNDLMTPINDVREFSNLLLDGDVGGFDICINSKNDDRTTILRKIVQASKACEPNDTFVLYYSGHGVALPENLGLYLTACETELDNLRATGIPITDVLSVLDSCVAKRQMVILDACHSGAFHLSTPKDFGHTLRSLAKDTNELSEGVGRYFICAADEDSPAIGSSDVSNDKLSILTSAICLGLDNGEADVDADGFVSMNDLTQYCDKVLRNSPPYSWSYKTAGKSFVARNKKFKGFDYRSLSALDDELISGLANNKIEIQLGSISELSRIAREDGENADAASVALTYLASSIESKVRTAASDGLKHALRMFAVPEVGLTETRNATSSVRIQPAYNVTIEFQFVSAGHFLMGGDTEHKFTKSDQLPLHLVETGPYWISKAPITQAQFSQFVQEHKYRPSSERQGADCVSYNVRDNRYHKAGRNWRKPFSKSNTYDVFRDHPVVFISFWDAVEFCKWASARTGLIITLPSEAEWEKAARGNDDRQWPWGNKQPSSHHANFGHRTRSTTPVGFFAEYGASPYGCVDMSGNVWEWTTGQYKKYPYSLARHPENLRDNSKRVLRGGSWNVGENRTTVSFRKKWSPNRCCDGHGFRPVIRMSKEQVENLLA